MIARAREPWRVRVTRVEAVRAPLADSTQRNEVHAVPATDVYALDTGKLGEQSYGMTHERCAIGEILELDLLDGRYDVARGFRRVEVRS